MKKLKLMVRRENESTWFNIEFLLGIGEFDNVVREWNKGGESAGNVARMLYIQSLQSLGRTQEQIERAVVGTLVYRLFVF